MKGDKREEVILSRGGIPSVREHPERARAEFKKGQLAARYVAVAEVRIFKKIKRRKSQQFERTTLIPSIKRQPRLRCLVSFHFVKTGPFLVFGPRGGWCLGASVL